MPINTQNFGNTAQGHSETSQSYNGSVTNQEQQDENIRLADIERSLTGIKFPANKNDLVEYAVEQGAPSYIVNILQQLQTPEFGSGNDKKLTMYNNIDELMRELKQTG